MPSVVLVLLFTAAFLIDSSAAMDSPGHVDSSRASVFHVNPLLVTSSAVRAVFSQCGAVEDEFVASLLSPGCSR